MFQMLRYFICCEIGIANKLCQKTAMTQLPCPPHLWTAQSAGQWLVGVRSWNNPPIRLRDLVAWCQNECCDVVLSNRIQEWVNQADVFQHMIINFLAWQIEWE